jgi:hypothetical protein
MRHETRLAPVVLLCVSLGLTPGCGEPARQPEEAASAAEARIESEAPAGEAVTGETAEDVQNSERARSGHLVLMGGGFWVRRRDSGSLADPSDELRNLPYVSGAARRDAELGVTIYDPQRAASGLNLYTSAHGSEALLMDMEGEVLYRWSYEIDELWPAPPSAEQTQPRGFFRRVHLFGDGDLLVIFENTGLIRIDRFSELEWSHAGRNHHDLAVAGDGTILVLGSEEKVVPELRESPIIADNVTTLTPDGEVLDVLDIVGCLLASPYPALIAMARESSIKDTLHTNTLEILDGTQAARSPVFREGNLLVSMRNLGPGVIGILDPEKRALVWAAWGPWRMQHEPVLLPGGNMLLFDNRALEPDEPPSAGSSRVLEFDPLEKRIVWEYVGTPEAPFYSRLCGTASRLANGNTLVTESMYGRVFETTPEGEIVWEFNNPHVTGPDGEFVALIPELIRLPLDFPRWPLAPR